MGRHTQELEWAEKTWVASIQTWEDFWGPFPAHLSHPNPHPQQLRISLFLSDDYSKNKEEKGKPLIFKFLPVLKFSAVGINVILCLFLLSFHSCLPKHTFPKSIWKSKFL